MKDRKLKTAGRILLVPLRDLCENPLRPRIYYNDTQTYDLIRSVEENGIIEPLTVCPKPDGTYLIVSGGRRYRAAKALGYRRVPCVAISASTENLLFISVSNQLNQAQLSFFEVAQCCEKLHDESGLTYEQTAKRLGMSVAEEFSKLRLLQIPPKLRRPILENGLSESYAKLLLRHSDEQKEALLTQITEERLSLNEARARSAELLREASPRQGSIKTVYMDINVFINTIDRACAAMQQGGVDANAEKTEDENGVTYRIVIRKKAEARKQAASVEC